MVNPSIETQKFVDSLNRKFPDWDFEAMPGRRFDRIVITRNNTTRYVYAFMERSTADLYKPASWSAPAKTVRYSGYNLNKALKDADPYGSFLYLR